jgi:protein-tyrosine phosphatase
VTQESDTLPGSADEQAPWSRRVPLQGSANFRDIGGYPTAAGGRVRRGVVFRSGSLDELSEDDVPVLRSLGVCAVADLRRGPERAEVAPAWFEASGIAVTQLPIGTRVAHLKSIAERMIAGEIADFGTDDMVDIYTTLLTHYPEEFGAVVRLIARSEGATVVHCTAGKDRTGVAVALLLSFLGVDDATVAEDYALSQEHYSMPLLASLEVRFADLDADLDRVRAFFEAQPPVMLALLADLRARFGGAAAYLAGPAGVSPSDLSRLRERLLDGHDAARTDQEDQA